LWGKLHMLDGRRNDKNNSLPKIILEIEKCWKQ
jgi:hypothetical protein